MAKYLVVDGCKHHDGKEYQPGAVIECDEEVAQKMRLKMATADDKEKKKK